jgi:hypothetical protein
LFYPLIGFHLPPSQGQMKNQPLCGLCASSAAGAEVGISQTAKGQRLSIKSHSHV